MSYAIIRNIKCNKISLKGMYRHNERKNTSYKNKDINHNKTKNNYSIKTSNMTYYNKFQEIKEKYNLKGFIKSNSNVVCEMIITSDEEFFKSIGEEETKRYFKTGYEFVSKFHNLGEEYIISANVHMDEKTPHMHVVFVPVVHKKDTKSGKMIDKICCSEFWKGKNSYKILQDQFYECVSKAGFDLERGDTQDNKNIPIEKLKKITNYEMQEMFKESKHLEEEIISDDLEIIKKEYKKVIKKFNTLASRYTRVKNILDETIYKVEKIQKENSELKKETKELKNFIEKTFECVHLLFNFPIDNLKRIVKDFYKNMKGKINEKY